MVENIAIMKAIKLNHSLVVTIPKRFCDKMRIEKGTYLAITLNGDTIEIKKVVSDRVPLAEKCYDCGKVLSDFKEDNPFSMCEKCSEYFCKDCFELIEGSESYGVFCKKCTLELEKSRFTLFKHISESNRVRKHEE